MREPWVHVGRLWTNGDPFLAVDAALRPAWHGYSNDDYDQEVIPLGWEDTSVPVGAGRAVLVGADGVVRDDSWAEVFATAGGLVAVVQASGPDYPEVIARALGYPVTDDQDGDADDPGLLIPARHTEYELKVRWYTRLDEDNRFARWLLIPVRAGD